MQGADIGTNNHYKRKITSMCEGKNTDMCQNDTAETKQISLGTNGEMGTNGEIKVSDKEHNESGLKPDQEHDEVGPQQKKSNDGSKVKEEIDGTDSCGNDSGGETHENNAKSTTSSTMNQNVGRRGDPRMHKAVAIRLANPSMTLLDALIAGGFEFPNGTTNVSGDNNVYDSDNVLLCQRKNQLSRRIRLAKRRTCGATKKGSDDVDDVNDFSIQEESLNRNPALKRFGIHLEVNDMNSRPKAMEAPHKSDQVIFPPNYIPQSTFSLPFQQQLGQLSFAQPNQNLFGMTNPLLSPLQQNGLNNQLLQSHLQPFSNVHNNNLAQYLQALTSSAREIANPSYSVANDLHQAMALQAAMSTNTHSATTSRDFVFPKTDQSNSNQNKALFENKKSAVATYPQESDRKEKLEKAVALFNTDKKKLMQNYLFIAGFREQEVNDNLLNEFEKLLHN